MYVCMHACMYDSTITKVMARSAICPHFWQVCPTLTEVSYWHHHPVYVPYLTILEFTIVPPLFANVHVQSSKWSYLCPLCPHLYYYQYTPVILPSYDAIQYRMMTFSFSVWIVKYISILYPLYFSTEVIEHTPLSSCCWHIHSSEVYFMVFNVKKTHIMSGGPHDIKPDLGEIISL